MWSISGIWNSFPHVCILRVATKSCSEGCTLELGWLCAIIKKLAFFIIRKRKISLGWVGQWSAVPRKIISLSMILSCGFNAMTHNSSAKGLTSDFKDSNAAALFVISVILPDHCKIQRRRESRIPTKPGRKLDTRLGSLGHDLHLTIHRHRLDGIRGIYDQEFATWCNDCFYVGSCELRSQSFH